VKALLLAAGEGTRLRPLTLDRPKAMVEVAGRPAVAYELEWLKAQGATEVAINLFHRPDVLRDFIGDGARFGLRVRYSPEAPVAFGTAGALDPLRDFLAGEEVFVVLYGDVLTNLDLAPVLAQHRAMGADATVVVGRVENPAESGMVVFDAARRIGRFVEKPAGPSPSEWGNAGIYLCGGRLLDYVTAKRPLDFACDVFPRMIADGRTLGAFPTEAVVLEFGSVPRLARASAAIADGLLAAAPRL
jgi:NDP-sugar pyrophosphorylase family protein